MECLSNETSTAGRDNSVVPYQIECQTTKKGKMIAGSKRRICWKFGFSNRDAIEKGLSGSDCRGEEHEVVFVWSLTSGKKFVLQDGHEVHWSKQSPISEKFERPWEFSWESQMAGAKRKLMVVVNATEKNYSVVDTSFRNFNLLIDGVSFSEMSKMLDLGLNKDLKDHLPLQMAGNETRYENNYQQQPQRRKHVYDNGNLSHSSQPDLLSLQFENQQQQPYRQQQQALQHQAYLAASCKSMSRSMPEIHHNYSASPTSVMVGDGSVPPLNCHFTQQQPRSYQISPTSVTQMIAPSPFDHFTHQQPQPNQISPTSVTQTLSTSRFDKVTTGGFKPHLQQQQQLPCTQFNNNYYVPQPQQYQQSTVY